MQIACPQCSAEYDLDARLLPPGGVPVQCTRCRFVFTATPSAPPAAPGASPLNSTLIFGKSSGASGAASRPPASPPSPEASVPSAPRMGMTPPFGTPAAPASGTRETPRGFDAEQATGAPTATGAPAPARMPARSQTQIFGAGELSGLVAQARGEGGPPAVALPPEPSAAAPAPGTPRPPRPAPRTMSTELPPELLGGRPLRPAPAPVAEKKGWGGLLVLGLLGVLGVAAALAYPAWRKRANELPMEALATRDEATALLRRDDAASRAEAISRLRQLVSRFPHHTEPRADLALALALELDDVLLDNQRLRATEARLDQRIRAMSEAKAPADWVSRINAMNDELVALLREREPLAPRIQELVSETGELQRVLKTVPQEEPASDVLARARAQAVYAGVRSMDEALPLSVKLGSLEGPPQLWTAVARAEYALNANAQPGLLGEVATALESVREKDRTFLRAYVLGARVAMKLGDPHTAQALLDEVMALNPHHALARKLHTWSVDEANEASPSP